MSVSTITGKILYFIEHEVKVFSSLHVRQIVLFFRRHKIESCINYCFCKIYRPDKWLTNKRLLNPFPQSATTHNKSYKPLPDRFEFVLSLNKATAYSQTLCTMPRDRFGASNTGTFACHTFPRDTKASKRAWSVLY